MGALITKTHSMGGAYSYWKEGAKSNHYGKWKILGSFPGFKIFVITEIIIIVNGPSKKIMSHRILAKFHRSQSLEFLLVAILES